MHEMAICEGIFQVIEDQAKAQQCTRVRRVGMEIGPLAGVDVEALTFSMSL